MKEGIIVSESEDMSKDELLKTKQIDNYFSIFSNYL